MSQHVSFADQTGGDAQQKTPVKKRARDSRGIDKFRQIIYGDNGFRRLHAMVERNSTLMYPPANVRSAREIYLREESLVDAALRREHPDTTDVIDLADVVERRRRLEDMRSSMHENNKVANYHHKQLDCFLKLVYEFNHSSLQKLPMPDTLHMLSRCGREAVAHLTEFEMHARLKRLARIEEISKLSKEESNLAARHREAEALEVDEEMRRAEEQFRTTMESLAALDACGEVRDEQKEAGHDVDRVLTDDRPPVRLEELDKMTGEEN